VGGGGGTRGVLGAWGGGSGAVGGSKEARFWIERECVCVCVGGGGGGLTTTHQAGRRRLDPMCTQSLHP
jgi:hypothetical protein